MTSVHSYIEQLVADGKPFVANPGAYWPNWGRVIEPDGELVDAGSYEDYLRSVRAEEKQNRARFTDTTADVPRRFDWDGLYDSAPAFSRDAIALIDAMS